jgi:perosamine synthetase
MSENKVPWWTVKLTGDESACIARVLDSGFINEGPLTLKLEETFKDYFNVEHAIFTTSGTVAIYLALKALGVSVGTKVAVPNLTFVATASAVKLCGGIPVLIDIDPETLCIDSEDLLMKYEIHKFNYVVPVHISGRSAFSSKLLKVISDCELKVIEDAAEAFGSRDPKTKKFLGTIGLAGAYSFSPNKVLTSGQGGLIVTNDHAVAKTIRSLKDQGRTQRGTGGDDLHPFIGFNFKFTDIQAALIEAQLPSLNHKLNHLKSVYTSYRDLIDEDASHKMLNFDTASGEIPLWPEFTTTNRSGLEKILNNENVGYRNVWHPLNVQLPYAENGDFLVRSKIASLNTLWLPSSFDLIERDLLRVSSLINQFIRRKGIV